MVFIQTDDAVAALRRLGVALNDRDTRVVIGRSINAVLGKARTTARREIKSIYNISQKNLNGVDFQPANAATLTGKLYAARKPLPLDVFAPKSVQGGKRVSISRKGQQKVTVLKNRRKNVPGGVSIEVFRGKRELIPFAFMLPGGAVRVFARGGYRQGSGYGFVQRHQRVNSKGNDVPVKPLITISMFGQILNEDVMREIGKQARDAYPTEFERNVKFMLQNLK
jgi:hypothetical protein